MITTTKYGLKKPEATDSADLRVFVGDNMDILDGHGHDWADITTGKPTEFTPVLMGGLQRGGARVGNGLQMSGEYLLVRVGTGLAINGTTTAVDINRTVVDTWYSASGHKHDWADITTGKPTTFPPPLMASDRIGGARVGNGLTMSGEYLTVRAGSGVVVNATTYAVDVNRTVTDTWYAPVDHDHVWADITDAPTTMTPPLMAIDRIGGAMVGNGLGMSGDYLFVRTGTGLIIDPSMLNLAINRTVTDTWYAPADHDHVWADVTDAPPVIISDTTGTTATVTKIWSGTQVEYNALTRDANTLYYIIG